MYKKIMFVSFLLNSSLSYANNEISRDLESALMCKNFDKKEQDLSWVSHAGSLKELHRIEKLQKNSYPLAKEFFTKFKLKKSTAGESHYGFSKEYLPISVTPFNTITFIQDEGFGAELHTTRTANIEEIINDFKKSNPKIKIYHIDLQQVKRELKKTNYSGNSDNEYLNKLTDYIFVKKNGKEYYSNNVYVITSKNPKLIGAETIIYSNPLNNNLIHTSCILEFDE